MSKFLQSYNQANDGTTYEKDCICHKCQEGVRYRKQYAGMVLCPTCGNKRCPKASNHELDCTNSNEPGQEGSIHAKFVPPTKETP